jgi:hypothetical protein
VRILGILFLLCFSAKVLLIGLSDPLTQFGIPLVMLGLVAGMLTLSGAARAAMSGFTAGVPLVFLMMVLALASLCGAINGFPLADAAAAYLRVLLMMVTATGAYLCTAFGLGRQVALTLFATLAVHVIAALALYPLGVGFEIGGVLRPTGITGRPQLISNIAGFAIIVGLGQMLFIARRITFGGMLLVVTGSVFVLLSATLKNFIAVVLVSALMAASVRSRHRVLIFAAAGTLLAALVAYSLIALPIGERLASAAQAGVSVDVAQGDKLESSLMWRMLHWKLLLEDWHRRFFWTGAGFGQVGNMDALKTDSGDGYIAHSDWVGLFVETGPFLFSLIGLCLFWVYTKISAQASAGCAECSVTRFAFMLFVLMSVVGNVFYSAAFAYQFWLLLGYSQGQAFLVRSDRELAGNEGSAFYERLPV